jgi:DNA-directed RNA polymerase specialized sigma24 family protein
MRQGNGQRHADRDDQAADAQLEHAVCTIWRMLRGMGVSADDVPAATRACFASAREQLAVGASMPEPEPGLEGVVDPLLAAAFRAASAQWTRHVENAAESSVRYQGELLVLGLLCVLDETKRVCLLLADMEQLSTPEIAALTGLRLDVVYDELRKARKAFARARKGATSDAEADARELLTLARTRFSPEPAVLAGVCSGLPSGA